MNDVEQETGAASRTAGRTVKAATKDLNRVRDRREQLLDGAVRIFAQKGFHETTVRDIGRASGLTQGTIYNYVRSKEDILYLVCDRIVSQYLVSVHRAMASDGPTMVRLHAALDGIARVMVEHKDGILLLYHESHHLEKKSRRDIVTRVDEFITGFQSLLEEVDTLRARPAPSVRSLANIVTFLPTIFALRGWGFSSEASEAELIRDVVDFMVAGLRLPGPGQSSS